jgi:hypothetical protein
MRLAGRFMVNMATEKGPVTIGIGDCRGWPSVHFFTAS